MWHHEFTMKELTPSLHNMSRRPRACPCNRFFKIFRIYEKRKFFFKLGIKVDYSEVFFLNIGNRDIWLADSSLDHLSWYACARTLFRGVARRGSGVVPDPAATQPPPPPSPTHNNRSQLKNGTSQSTSHSVLVYSPKNKYAVQVYTNGTKEFFTGL